MHSTIVALNREHLGELIEHTLDHHGPAADLNHIDVVCITNMNMLFKDSPFVGNISRWDVSNVTAMARMFNGCPFNGDISRWNTSKVATMYEMFRGGSFCGDLSHWDVSRVRSMESMFHGKQCAPTGLMHWDVGQVETFFRMFHLNTTVPDLSLWRPKEDAYVDSMADRAFIDAMDQPCFFHWYEALHGRLPLHASWRDHFNAMAPLARGFGLEGMAFVQFMQDRWLERDAPAMQALALPDLGAP